ncbi:hypothetical protein HBI24_204150 [Parastagonospora nodorum]|nr:hypothetical protein HBH53_111510 [Parastagonospora nodorum]KAH3970835.1 hypothetical protein HBH52_160000 [Parastagonospora nodorum]KAH4065464.1 hypothetical protein HBH50_166770 [Parastagonospora nodorum]KAH4084865.1 hypothetical protein HBH48_164500 [Parastagonospora nodorum]KAH4193260.1 hypothetical protein HBH42_098230 [Parastagonospora nodorum]
MQQGSILPFLQKPKPPRPENSRPENSRAGQPYRPRNPNPRGNFRGNSSRNHRAPDRRRNMDLKKIADETKAELPNVLSQLPSFDAMDSSVFSLNDLATLDAKDCPGFVLSGSDVKAGEKGTRIKVFDMDTFDAAIDIAPSYDAKTHLASSVLDPSGFDSKMDDEDDIMVEPSQDSDATPATSSNVISSASRKQKPVAVLNLASERSAGGGWQNGALAQEEALCYRSSLYLSLHKSYYPLPSLSAIYSPSVLIIRDAMSRGHSLLTPAEQPANLPVTSVISVAALRYPALTDDKKSFKNEGQRAETKRKIRLTLRVAALGGHTKLVMGALGCGVFGNPPKEVADCFLEVFRESEFQGGWWEEVVFAIMDNARGDQGGKDGVGNYGQFYRVLDGQAV